MFGEISWLEMYMDILHCSSKFTSKLQVSKYVRHLHKWKKTSGAKFTPTFEQPSTYSVIKGWTKDPSSVHKHDMYQVLSAYGRTPQLVLISFCTEKYMISFLVHTCLPASTTVYGCKPITFKSIWCGSEILEFYLPSDISLKRNM